MRNKNFINILIILFDCRVPFFRQLRDSAFKKTKLEYKEFVGGLLQLSKKLIIRSKIASFS